MISPTAKVVEKWDSSQWTSYQVLTWATGDPSHAGTHTKTCRTAPHSTTREPPGNPWNTTAHWTFIWAETLKLTLLGKNWWSCDVLFGRPKWNPPSSWPQRSMTPRRWHRHSLSSALPGEEKKDVSKFLVVFASVNISELLSKHAFGRH